MTIAAQVAARVGDCVAAAYLDALSGEVLDHVVRDPDDLPPAALEVAAELLRLRDRPLRLVLLSATHVHLVQRIPAARHRALVVICRRAANLGVTVALVRAFAQDVAA